MVHVELLPVHLSYHVHEEELYDDALSITECSGWNIKLHYLYSTTSIRSRPSSRLGALHGFVVLCVWQTTAYIDKPDTFWDRVPYSTICTSPAADINKWKAMGRVRTEMKSIASIHPEENHQTAFKIQSEIKNNYDASLRKHPYVINVDDYL